MAEGDRAEIPHNRQDMTLSSEPVGAMLTELHTAVRAALAAPQPANTAPLRRNPKGDVSQSFDLTAELCAQGFLRDYLAAESRFLVRVPENLRQVAVLTEPMSIVTKGIAQSVEFHRRSAHPVQVAASYPLPRMKLGVLNSVGSRLVPGMAAGNIVSYLLITVFPHMYPADTAVG